MYRTGWAIQQRTTEVFKAIRKYNSVELSSLEFDIALMTTRELFHFQKIENKLKRGHYRLNQVKDL